MNPCEHMSAMYRGWGSGLSYTELRNKLGIANRKIAHSFLNNEVFLTVKGNGRNVLLKIIKSVSEEYKIFFPELADFHWRSLVNRDISISEFERKYKHERPLHIYAKLSDAAMGLLRMNVANSEITLMTQNTGSRLIIYLTKVYPYKKNRRYAIINLVDKYNEFDSFKIANRFELIEEGIRKDVRNDS